MVNAKNELLKLAKALGKSGYEDFKNNILSLAQQMGSLSPAQTNYPNKTKYPYVTWSSVEYYWKYHKVSDHYKVLGSASGATAMFDAAVKGWGTDDGEVYAALFYGTDKSSADVIDATKADFSGTEEHIALMIIDGTINKTNFDPVAGKWLNPAVGNQSQQSQSQQQQGSANWTDVQNKLNALGAKDSDGNQLDPDGKWGPKTSRAWNDATKEKTTATQSTDLTPVQALARLNQIAPAQPAQPAQTQTANATKATIYNAYMKFPDGDPEMVLAARNDFYKAAKRTVNDIEDYNDLNNAQKDYIHKAYLADKAKNPKMEMKLQFYRPQAAAPATPTFNSADFISDGNLYMRKTDGEVFYASDPSKPNKLTPLSERSIKRDGTSYLTNIEQRKLMRRVRQELPGPSNAAARRMYRQSIAGQRRSSRGINPLERTRGRDRADKARRDLRARSTK